MKYLPKGNWENKTKKRIIALLLCFCLAITFVPTTALATLIPGTPTSNISAIEDANGNAVSYDSESWEQVFPYGAFAFQSAESDVTEGGDGKMYCTLSSREEDEYTAPDDSLEAEPKSVNGYYEAAFEPETYGEYGGSRFAVTFDEGEWIKYIKVTALTDGVAELPEFGAFTMVKNLGGELYSTCATNVLQVNNIDPYGESTIGFAVSSASFDQKSGTASVVIRREGDKSYPISVDYKTVDGTAAAGKQYTSVSGTAMFAGDIDEVTVNIPLIAGEKRESKLTFDLVLDGLKGTGDGSQYPCSLDESAVKMTVSLTSSGMSHEDGQNLPTVLTDGDRTDISGLVTVESDALISASEVITGQQEDASVPEDVVNVTYGEAGQAPGARTYDYGGVRFQYDATSDGGVHLRHNNSTGTLDGGITNFEAGKCVFTIAKNSGILFKNVSWVFDFEQLGYSNIAYEEYEFVAPSVSVKVPGSDAWTWNCDADNRYLASVVYNNIQNPILTYPWDRTKSGSSSIPYNPMITTTGNSRFTVTMRMRLRKLDDNKFVDISDLNRYSDGSSSLRLTELKFERRTLDNTQDIGLKYSQPTTRAIYMRKTPRTLQPALPSLTPLPAFTNQCAHLSLWCRDKAASMGTALSAAIPIRCSP